MFEKLLFRSLAALAAAALLAATAQAVDIDTVRVGNPGNAGEHSGQGGSIPSRTCGAVEYAYNIGTYEVTAGQYCEFLNAVAATDTYELYDREMSMYDDGCQITRHGTSGSYTYDFSNGTIEVPGSTAADWQDRPVNCVSWGDAARFANWLHNGQPGLDTPVPQDLNSTEDGAYFLNGATDGLSLLAVSREADWKWAIPTEDEWYKAAYYDPSLNDGAGGYYDYPAGSDSVPSNDLNDPDPGNNATFFDGVDVTIDEPYYRTEFGAHEESESPYGTFDQGGNVKEWNETSVHDAYYSSRGGSWGFYTNFLHASTRYYLGPTLQYIYAGIRVVSVPEPGSITLLVCGLLVGMIWRRRRR